MHNIYSEEKVNRISVILCWVGILSAAVVQYFNKYSFYEAGLNLLFSSIFLIPTIIYFTHKQIKLYKYFLIFGIIVYVYVMTYLQQGPFDNTYYLFIALVATSLYFDILLTVCTTAFLIITSIVFYAWFKPFIFPQFHTFAFMSMQFAFVLTSALICVQTFWSRRLVLSQTVLHKKALIDSLTKIYNRAFIDESFDRVITEHRELEKDLSVIIMDIDDFKGINDSLGHRQGDLVLKEVADRLVASIRKQDIVARFGGDEFLIVLQDTGSEAAEIVAEKIVRAIKSQEYMGIPMTVSLGVTTLKDMDTEQSFFNRADKALYDAKAGGKNCFVVI